MNEVLNFWFGDDLQWRSKLWWGCVDSQRRLSRVETIDYMRSTFNNYIQDNTWKDWNESGSIEGKVASIILLSQIHRVINKERRFEFDEVISKISNSAADDIGASISSLPWTYICFIYIALCNSEIMFDVRRAIVGFTSIISHHGGVGSSVGTRVNKCFKDSIRMRGILEKFKRDPLRNELLGRESTQSEMRYISAVEAKSSPKQSNVVPEKSVSTKTGLIRVLVLHGLRQNGRSFSRAAKQALTGISKNSNVEFVFADAPHKSSFSEGNVQMIANTGRHWYNSTTSESGDLIYEGLDESIEYLNNYFNINGPFQCVIGFSQGACIAAIMASLQASGSDKAKYFTPKCYICISGGECRDSRDRFKDLHSTSMNLEIPSFHIYGETDTIMPSDRTVRLSQVFRNPLVKSHSGDHFKKAIGKWPIDDISNWLDQLQVSDNTQFDSSVIINPLESQPEPDLQIKLSSTMKCRGSEDDLFPLIPVGICNKFLLTTTFWETCKSKGKTIAIDPHVCFQQSDIREFVKEMRGHPSVDTKTIDSDLLLLSWCQYVNVGKKRLRSPFKKKEISNSDYVTLQERSNQTVYWLWWAIINEQPTSESRFDITMKLLHSIQYYGGWEDMERLCLLSCTGTSRKVNVREKENNCLCDVVQEQDEESHRSQPVVRELLETVSQLIADKLYEDYQKCISASTSERPSDCVLHCLKTRRTYSAKKTELVKLTSDKLVRNMESILPSKATYDKIKKFNEVVKSIKDILNTKYNLDYYNLKKSIIYSNWKENIIDQQRSQQEYQQLVSDLPLSQMILHPEPEPVDIATGTQMQPVLDYIKTADKLKKANDFIAFTKGTMCGDGRLDLCKQVIGPKGIEPLLDSLRNDNQSKVRHLLLGNNIAGDNLGNGVADMVINKSSSVSTWYIAGNHLTDVGIKPLCDALQTDDYVNQLWLKRNPLKPFAAVHLSKMISLNRHLKVLDLTCTGLLDEGTEILMKGLTDNKHLQVLYLNGNGITIKSIPSICDMLRKPTGLRSLGLGCNRLGDEGAKMLFSVTDMKLEMLDVSSSGIGSVGSTYVAEFLKINKTVRKLDLGFLIMTVAIGELCNRIENFGAEQIAEALRFNTTLLSLSLRHNAIDERGHSAFRLVLGGSLDNSCLRNKTLIDLTIDQYGFPLSRINREGIKTAIRQNMELLSKAERKEANEVVSPPHLAEVLSVYRLGGKYPLLDHNIQ